jgi:peptide/nickel transport system substrate-binding protein
LFFPYYTGSPSADTYVENVRQELKQVGIEIETKQFAPATFFAPFQDHGIVYGGKWDMTFFSWQSLPGADISNNWECNQIPPNGQNVSHFCNAQLDALLRATKATYDPVKQKALLDQEIKIIVANAPTIVTSNAQVGFTYSKGLTGFKPNAWTPFDNFMDVDI